jgi:hypothetical protein
LGWPLGRFVALQQRCRAFVGGDTGPLHTAVAAGTPTLGLLSRNRPAMFFPYDEAGGHRAYYARVECSPCHRDECDDLRCLKRLTVDSAWRLLEGMLEENVNEDQVGSAPEATRARRVARPKPAGAIAPRAEPAPGPEAGVSWRAAKTAGRPRAAVRTRARPGEGVGVAALPVTSLRLRPLAGSWAWARRRARDLPAGADRGLTREIARPGQRAALRPPATTSRPGRSTSRW